MSTACSWMMGGRSLGIGPGGRLLRRGSVRSSTWRWGQAVGPGRVDADQPRLLPCRGDETFVEDHENLLDAIALGAADGARSALAWRCIPPAERGAHSRVARMRGSVPKRAHVTQRRQPSSKNGPMHRRLSVTVSAVLRLALVTVIVSATVVLAGGTAAWHLEKDRPDSTFLAWGDGVWWALTTMTTTGYGDHVPETANGRVIAALIMIVGVGVLGAVAAVVALIFNSAVAIREERMLEAEGRTLEARLEARLDVLDERLAQLEKHVRRPHS